MIAPAHFSSAAPPGVSSSGLFPAAAAAVPVPGISALSSATASRTLAPIFPPGAFAATPSFSPAPAPLPKRMRGAPIAAAPTAALSAPLAQRASTTTALPPAHSPAPVRVAAHGAAAAVAAVPSVASSATTTATPPAASGAPATAAPAPPPPRVDVGRDIRAALATAQVASGVMPAPVPGSILSRAAALSAGHQHPRMREARRSAHFLALSAANRDRTLHGSTCIVDIGGSINGHQVARMYNDMHGSNRLQFHILSPIVDGQDLIRSQLIPRGATLPNGAYRSGFRGHGDHVTGCDCLASVCTHMPIRNYEGDQAKYTGRSYLLVHSFYHLDLARDFASAAPGDMIYVVTHRFDGSSGTIAGGEFEWRAFEREGVRTIAMTPSSGFGQGYVHRDTTPLLDGFRFTGLGGAQYEAYGEPIDIVDNDTYIYRYAVGRPGLFKHPIVHAHVTPPPPPAVPPTAVAAPVLDTTLDVVGTAGSQPATPAPPPPPAPQPRIPATTRPVVGPPDVPLPATATATSEQRLAAIDNDILNRMASFPASRNSNGQHDALARIRSGVAKCNQVDAPWVKLRMAQLLPVHVWMQATSVQESESLSDLMRIAIDNPLPRCFGNLTTAAAGLFGAAAGLIAPDGMEGPWWKHPMFRCYRFTVGRTIEGRAFEGKIVETVVKARLKRFAFESRPGGHPFNALMDFLGRVMSPPDSAYLVHKLRLEHVVARCETRVRNAGIAAVGAVVGHCAWRVYQSRSSPDVLRARVAREPVTVYGGALLATLAGATAAYAARDAPRALVTLGAIAAASLAAAAARPVCAYVGSFMAKPPPSV